MLTKIQKDTLTGLMLGDGNLELHKNAKNACLRICRKSSDRRYLLFNASIFENYLTANGVYEKTIFDKRIRKYYKSSRMRTTCHPIFTKYHKLWYPNNKKSIYENIMFNPHILSIWFADDGCVSHVSTHTLECKLATDGFSKDEVYYLKNKLDDYFNHRDFKVYKNGDGYQIRCFGYYAKLFFREIDSVFPESMSRKSSVWRNPQYQTFQNKPIYTCKFCESNSLYRNGVVGGRQKLLCKDCRRQFYLAA